MIRTTYNIDEYLDFDFNNLDNTEPLYRYILEPKSQYTKASQVINPKTGKYYYDPDGDWLIGESGGFLPNINFIFKRTDRLREAALFYQKNKTYTFLKEDTVEHRQFRKREQFRRKTGYTANCKLHHRDIEEYNFLLKKGDSDSAYSLLKPLRITGEQYNFINYGKIRLLDEHSVSDGSIGAEKKDSTPLFIDSQYWLSKAKEFAKANGYHMIVLKSRRKGMSYVEAIDSANDVNLHSGTTIIHGAYDKKYVTQGRSISPMAKLQLEFYEFHTPFHRNSKGRGLLKKDIEELKVGYKRKDGTDAGKQSTILALSFMNNPDAAIGKDAHKIKFDELSAFPNFEDVMDVTVPTTTTGAYLTGFIFAGGTGGSKEGSWAQFERNFNSVDVYNFMPFENIWDFNSRHRKVGWFIPYWYGLQGKYQDSFSLDKDGNSIYRYAIGISNNERALKAAATGGASTKRYLKHCSQFSNRPSEAFSSSTDNLFSSGILTNHIERIRAERKELVYKDGFIIKDSDEKYKFKTLSQLEELAEQDPTYKKLLHKYIENFPILPDDDPHGCMRMWSPPYRDQNGNVPDDVYTICYDTIGKDIDSKEIKIRHSLNAFYVITLPNAYGIPPDTIMLSYAGRTDKMETCDKFVLDTSYLYNAKIVPETDRGTIVSNFRSWGEVNRIVKDPTYILQGKEAPANTGYGIVIGSGERAEEGLKYLNEWFYDVTSVREDGSYFHIIERVKDLPTLLEAAKYSKGINVDRLSALRVWMFYRRAFKLKQTRNKNANNSTNTVASQMGLK